MIRTHIIPCKLPKSICNAMNRESGCIYTDTMLMHWDVLNRTKIWLNQYDATKINDKLRKNIKKYYASLHSHSIDAAQAGFYKALITSKAARNIGYDIKYPWKYKWYRTTIWKNDTIKFKNGVVLLSNGSHGKDISFKFNIDVLKILEVRLVFNKRAKKYFWHIVVENGKSIKTPSGTNIVSIDLGEIHPAVIGDENESVIISCRELRSQKQGHNKRLAKISKAISRKRKGSRKYKQLIKTKTRLKSKYENVVKNITHKISKTIVDVAIELQSNTIVVGDIRKIGDKVNLGTCSNQKISQWNHGKLLEYVEYKADAEGIALKLINEAFTSQTCPKCQQRHKPKGRKYFCPSCGFQSHRDIVGQINILSKYKYNDVGRILPSENIKYRRPAVC